MYLKLGWKSKWYPKFVRERLTQPCEMAEWIRGGWKYISSSKKLPGCWLLKGDALLLGPGGRAVVCKYLEDKSPRSETAVILITSNKLLIMFHSWEYKSLCSTYFLSNIPLFLRAVLPSCVVSSLNFSPFSKKLSSNVCILLILARDSLWAYQNCDWDKYAVQERGTDENGK